MKKLILSFAIVALATLGANAQVKFGIKAGMNIANLRVDGDDDDELKSLIGANGGVFANIPVSSMFSVQPEVLYSMEGTKLDGGKYALNYVNIPVMLRYNNPSGFFGEFGPQIGLLTSAKAKPDGDGDDFDIKDAFKSTNFSLGLGAGFNFTPAIGVGLRYNLGLSSISDDDDVDIKTGNFSIGVHYTFGQSK